MLCREARHFSGPKIVIDHTNFANCVPKIFFLLNQSVIYFFVLLRRKYDTVFRKYAGLLHLS